MNILVVEDEPSSRKMLQNQIEKLGHTVFTANNGQEALECIQKENIKLVIADWLMPVLDGLELCKKIRASADSGYTYLMLLTAKDRKKDIIKGLEAGADDYVTKPFDWEEIKVRIRTGERILNLEKQLISMNQELLNVNIKLKEMASIDPLMGIGNRRHLHDVMDKAHHRACRYDQHYGIIMCDIDFFKAYNDYYGHLQGDKVLERVAASIKESLRTSDDIFRYGGEEILVFLPDQDAQSSFLAAERIRKVVETLSIEHKGSEKGIVTISCGVAAFDGECSDIKWTATVERADQAVYRSKSSGRNKVSC